MNKIRRNFFSISLLIFLSTWVDGGLLYAQTTDIKNSKSESDQKFVERVIGQRIVTTEELANCLDSTRSCGIESKTQIARTRNLISGKEVIVAFTESPFNPIQGDMNEHDIDGHVFIEHDEIRFSRYSIPAICEVEGGNPTLRAFFVINLGEATNSLAVICGWDAVHSSDCPMNDEVRFIKVSENGMEILPMTQYKNIFYRKVRSNTDSKMFCNVPNFANAADIRALLKKHP